MGADELIRKLPDGEVDEKHQTCSRTRRRILSVPSDAKEGRRYEPWYRFHYPVHYYYDLLVGLEFITALGFGDDSRLRFAISMLNEKRRLDGRWNLDAAHPDPEGTHYSKPPTPFALEQPGGPSKMITFLGKF